MNKGNKKQSVEAVSSIISAVGFEVSEDFRCEEYKGFVEYSTFHLPQSSGFPEQYFSLKYLSMNRYI